MRPARPTRDHKLVHRRDHELAGTLICIAPARCHQLLLLLVIPGFKEHTLVPISLPLLTIGALLPFGHGRG